MFLLEHESLIRLGCFLGLLALFALLEQLAPRRPWRDQLRRKGNNLGLSVVNSLAVRFLVPVSAVGMALVCERQSWGLFPALALSIWLVYPLALIAFDGAIYLQHVLFHAVPVLWRLHRVHHADEEMDVTTGVRFHTLEIALSGLFKVAMVAVLGPPAAVVVLFEVLLNATSLFNHSNVRLPAWLDSALRLVLVTPDMHRVHHSLDPTETNSNFGFALPWWDYLFGTYRAQPAAGHDAMQLGVRGLSGWWVEWLPGLLAMPFRRVPSSNRAAAPWMDVPLLSESRSPAQES